MAKKVGKNAQLAKRGTPSQNQGIAKPSISTAAESLHGLIERVTFFNEENGRLFSLRCLLSETLACKLDYNAFFWRKEQREQ